ncbi:carboxypeptidase regulatory-like domain-containing protein [bacterium]|nr:carboxypeptidase regulatory-like domain-containing protein [bacterium]
MKRITFASALLSLLVAVSVTGCGRTPLTRDTAGAAKLTVLVQDDQGPVPGANVEVTNADGQAAGTGVQADEEGQAVFEGLPAGDGYTVVAEYDGATGRASNVSVGNGRSEAVTITLQTHAGPGGIIAGTVKVAGTERALPGAKVEVVGAGVSAVADSTGHYKLENVPAGQQRIKSSYAGFHDGVRDLTVKAGTSNSLVIEMAPQSAGNRAQHTVITGTATVLEVDQWRNPVANAKTSEAWSAVVHPTSGNLLIADARKDAVVETTEKGTTLKTYNATSWMTLGLGGLKAPRGANYTPSGTILVADTGKNRIVEMDATEKKVWEMKTRLNAPRWAERQRTGTTLIVDTGNNRLVEVDRSGNPVWGLGDGSGNIVNRPTHATRLANGNTLVTDSGNNRVMEVNPQGQLVWMIGGSRPVADGKNLSNPNSAIRLPGGTTLIADTGNNRVIEVDSKNTVVWQMPVSAPLFAVRI